MGLNTWRLGIDRSPLDTLSLIMDRHSLNICSLIRFFSIRKFAISIMPLRSLRLIRIPYGVLTGREIFSVLIKSRFTYPALGFMDLIPESLRLMYLANLMKNIAHVMDETENAMMNESNLSQRMWLGE